MLVLFSIDVEIDQLRRNAASAIRRATVRIGITMVSS